MGYRTRAAAVGWVGVYRDALLLGSSDGFVLKLDATSGEVQWSTRLNGEVMSVPGSDGRMVLAHTLDGKLQGLDFATGEVAWTYDSNVPVLTLRGSCSPLLNGNVAYVGFATGRVLAFDIANGGIIWEARVAIPQGRSEIERVVDIDGTMTLLGNGTVRGQLPGQDYGDRCDRRAQAVAEQCVILLRRVPGFRQRLRGRRGWHGDRHQRSGQRALATDRAGVSRPVAADPGQQLPGGG